MWHTLELIKDEAIAEAEKSQGNQRTERVTKGRLKASNVGERYRDEGDFMPFPSSAVLFFPVAQIRDVYLDLGCIFWTDPSLGFLKLLLCVWASLKES